jgi:hypothetical protein
VTRTGSRSAPAWVDRCAPLALGAVALAGLAVAVVPQHAASITRLLLATLVGCAALVAAVELLRVDLDAAAGTAAPSALDRPPAPPLRPMEPPGLAAARRALHQRATPPGAVRPSPEEVAAAARRVLDDLGP